MKTVSGAKQRKFGGDLGLQGKGAASLLFHCFLYVKEVVS
jgi:hypothetical protein